MNDTALSESAKANTGRIMAEHRTRRAASLIGMLREPRYADFEILIGETAIGHEWTSRPKDNAFTLLFCRPCESGLDYWMLEEKRVRGHKIFRLYFCFSGPTLLIEQSGRALEFAPLELVKFNQEIRRILSKDPPLLR